MSGPKQLATETTVAGSSSMVTSLMLPARKRKLKHKITSDRRCFLDPLGMFT